MIMNEAAGTKVNHFDLTFRVALDQDIFWLEITVNQPEPMDEI